MGIASSSSGIGITAAQSLLSSRAVARGSEPRFAAQHRSSAPPELDHVAAEIARSVESRLPGRVSELQVRVVDDHFVLSGASNSYYVKQVAQHLAMNALDSHMLGRLVNEIEVR